MGARKPKWARPSESTWCAHVRVRWSWFRASVIADFARLSFRPRARVTDLGRCDGEVFLRGGGRRGVALSRTWEVGGLVGWCAGHKRARAGLPLSVYLFVTDEQMVVGYQV